MIEFELDGHPVSVPAEGFTLLEVLRDRLGVRCVKDGCSPQGQCGCCTVWVDGQPRVACVTPAARIAGRRITTVDGLTDSAEWGARMCATGGSQCGFCTPGIVMRLAAIPAEQRTETAVRQALLAHVCRCTGWQGVLDAACGAVPPIDRSGSEHRAALEGGSSQQVSPAVSLGGVPFAADSAPAGALAAVLAPSGEWVVGATVTDARRTAGAVPARRTTEALQWPIDVPVGDWAITLQTAWVEPAYLEPDAAWCVPGGEPVGPLTNGGAFGAKVAAAGARWPEVAAVARQLADQHQRPVVAVYSRTDVTRRAPKRPPMAIALRSDGTGRVHVARTPGVRQLIEAIAPSLEVVEVDVVGPPTSVAVRGAGWVEVAVAVAALRNESSITAPNGAWAEAEMLPTGVVQVRVRCGDVLDEVVLRSYCVGAAHMAMGWVHSEAVVVSDTGEVLDVTMRSFGIIRAVDMPRVEVTILPDQGEPVNGSDAVFAAVALAAWRAAGFTSRWPTMRA